MSLGRSVERVEDRVLSSGTARFVRDHHPDGTLWMAFARSKVAHAVLETVDVSAASAVPGVVDVLAGQDLTAANDMVAPLERDGRPIRSVARPLLARERIRFYGEPLAVVTAESQYAAYDGAAAVTLRSQPLPVVVDAVTAAAPNAPLLYEPESNVLFEEAAGLDEARAALADCAQVVSRRFTVGRYNAAPLETRGIVVQPAGAGVTVWASTQAPAQLKRAILASVDLPPDAVRVIVPRVGGGFGQKAHAYPEEVLAVLCCLRTGRPVKWLESRPENLQTASQARDQVVYCEAGCDRDGRVRVLLCDVLSDIGAYGVWPHGPLLEAIGTPTAMPGAYELSAFGYRTRAVATNKCPGGAYRGVGFAVATFVRERIGDILARERGESPVAFRLRNCGIGLQSRTTATGLELRGDYEQVLREVDELLAETPLADHPAAADADVRLGTGHALYVEPVSPGALVFGGRGMAGIVGYDEARVRLDVDGRIIVVTSSPPIGQGTETTFGQVAAEALGCSRELVCVDPSDTVGGLDGTGTFASRSAASVSVACEAAARELRRRLLQEASRSLAVAADELDVEGDAVVAPRRAGLAVSLADLARSATPGALDVTRRHDPGAGGVAYGAHACTVAVDVGTGQVRVLRYAVVEDCGEMINPGIVASQTLGGVAQALGTALLERLQYDENGVPTPTGLADYRVPRVTDAPRCAMRHVKTEATAGRRLGVGEGGAVGGAAAIANAVSDAIGVEVNSMPFDAATVWRLCSQHEVGAATPLAETSR
jgi:carbon-monoxide dehydrogenase large subunit